MYVSIFFFFTIACRTSQANQNSFNRIGKMETYITISVLSFVTSSIWILINLMKLSKTYLGILICITGVALSVILAKPDVVPVNLSSSFHVLQVTVLLLELLLLPQELKAPLGHFLLTVVNRGTLLALSHTQLNVSLLLWFLTIDLNLSCGIAVWKKVWGLQTYWISLWAILQNFLVLLLTKLLPRRELTSVESYFYAACCVSLSVVHFGRPAATNRSTATA